MRAIRVHAPGDADVLRLEDVPDPEPGPGEAVVRIEAAGVNFIEVYQRTGTYPQPLPFTPGSEGAGTVVAVGRDVTAVREGDRVASESLRGCSTLTWQRLRSPSASNLTGRPKQRT